MSASVKDAQSLPSSQHDGRSVQKSNVPTGNYKGFVAGVFSGIAKLSGIVLSPQAMRKQFTNNTLRKEGPQGLYKGATPPLIGWMFMDSLMLGSLTFYRRMLNDKFFQPMYLARGAQAQGADSKLPTIGHAMAGVMAGATVSFIAAPVEHIKARLQVQYSADKTKRLYSGPIDCSQKIYKQHGMRGLYHGLGATLIFRTFFFFWWGSYDLFTRALGQHTSLSTPAINFWAGGLSAQVFWITSYPSDVVKQRIMTDTLGPGRRFPRWRDAARAVYQERGWKGFFRGFVPCILRAFPANACALVAFEGVMRFLD
ncbi:hypothetical protein MBLNU459_g4426t2 [Dothideomycetes sp. NU459]